MFNLPKIRVIEFLQLTEEAASAYIRLQTVMNPKNEFQNKKAKPIGHLTFGQVKQMQRDFRNPTFEQIIDAFILVFDVTKHQVLRSWITDFFHASNHLIKEISATIEKENKALASDPDPDMVNAGIERLNVFGELSVLYDLGARYGMDPEEIENWKYNKVLSIMVHDHIVRQIQTEYSEIKKKAI